MKSFRVCIKTNPSGLWLLDEDEFVHFILAPAMDYAKRNGLSIMGFYLVDEVLEIQLQGAADMVSRFLGSFEDYVAYALAQRRPEYSNNAFGKISGLITVLPVWSNKEGDDRELPTATFAFRKAENARLSNLLVAPP